MKFNFSFACTASYFKCKKAVNNKGFSLIELLIAFSLAGFILVSLAYLVTSSISSRHKSVHYNQIVLLAVQKMNEIKPILEEKDEKENYKDFPHYSFEYSIKEEELNLLELSKDFGLDQFLPEDDPTKAFLEQRQNNVSDAQEFGIFKLLHYKVTTRYKNNLKYTLDFYRGKF